MTLLENTWTLNKLGQDFLNAATPKITRSFIDSKQAVDKELKRVCEDFILETSQTIFEPFSSFILKVKNI